MAASSGSRMQYDYLVKLLLIGDSGVGKSNLLSKFTDDKFLPHMAQTIGMDFKVKMLELGGRRMKLQIWDTAGQERFRALIPGYLRDSSACVVVYDITSRPSFEGVRGWVDQALQDREPRELVLALVGNKVDLEAERAVQAPEGEALAKELGMLFFEASARTADCVDAIFDAIALALPSDAPSQRAQREDEEIVLEAPRDDEAARASKRKCC
mmetsp:Transcript_95587/g.297103  ORF Transcript_95587/g.297103 Transcript_95587/m.297103 type:complete len:212 (-) Transcript_95587:15-650(-)